MLYCIMSSVMMLALFRDIVLLLFMISSRILKLVYSWGCILTRWLIFGDDIVSMSFDLSLTFIYDYGWNNLELIMTVTKSFKVGLSSFACDLYDLFCCSLFPIWTIYLDACYYPLVPMQGRYIPWSLIMNLGWKFY